MRHFLIRRPIRTISIGLLGFVALVGAYLGGIQLTGNFNTVIAGELYRSGQLSPSQIASYTKRFGIKTIINLRGNNKGSAWYDGELAESEQLHVTHVDFGISARRELTMAQAEALISLMREAQKPILIHCQAGADRSGLASALYLAGIKDLDGATAKGQLSIRYGHVSLPFIPEFAMDRTFKLVAPVLASRARNALTGQNDEIFGESASQTSRAATP